MIMQKNMLVKTRFVEESNYKSIFLKNTGKTIRFAIDPSKPVTELKHPEFYDIKFSGSFCKGKCKFCYLSETESPKGEFDNVIKVRKFFDSIPESERPYQIAWGTEIVDHPEFEDVMRICKEEYDIIPNYTTNGIWALEMNEVERQKVLEVTKKYCGGVAVTCHDHLEKYWKEAAKLYKDFGIRLNFHNIINDKASIDKFYEIFEEYKDIVDYFVILPFKAIGRASSMKEELEENWQYFVKNFPKDDKDKSKIAFGAKAYPFLLRGDLNVKISLYTPEILSKYVDFTDMSVRASSFSDKILNYLENEY